MSDERWWETLAEECPRPPWDSGDLKALCKALRDPAGRRRKLFLFAAKESDRRFALPEVRRTVKECRRYLFGRTKAPFKDLQDAAVWIRQQATAEIGDGEQSRDVAMSELARFSRPIILAFPGREAVQRVMVPSLGRLAALATAGQRISDATLCEPYQAIGHVLTGIPVLIAPLKATETLHWGDTVGPRRITIEVNFDWVTKGDVADYYQDCHQPSAPFVSRDDCLRLFRREIQGTAQECLQVWNARYPQWKYTSLGAFKTARWRASRESEMEG